MFRAAACWAWGPLPNTFGDSSTADRAAAEALRDTQAGDADWLALYNDNLSFWIRLVWDNGVVEQRRNAGGTGWQDVTNVIRGRVGTSGLDGAPGGGAIENYGITLDGTAARPVNEFIATGVMMGERGDTPYLAYRLVSNSTAILWFSTDELYDVAEAAAGDTSTDGSTGPPIVERNRLRMPESAGSSISGSVDAGRTAANELLLSTTTANVDITVEFFRYVTSVAQAGASEARVQELINASSLSALQGQVTDAQIPDAIMRDAELTAAVVRMRLGLTEDETNALFTGAVVVGDVLTITHNDGSTEDLPLPAGSGGGVDGVTDGAAFSSDGATFTIMRSVGPDIVVTVPAVLRSGTGGITVAERQKLAGIAEDANRLVPYKLGNIYIATASTVPDKPANTEGTASISGISVAPAGWQLTRPEATAALPWVYDCHVYGYVTNGVFGIQYGTPNRTDRFFVAGAADGTLLFGMGAPADSLGMDGDAYLNITSGGFYGKDGGTWTLRYTDMTGGVMPVGDHTRRGAISEDTTLTAAEINAGTSGTTQMVTMPTWTGGRRYLFIGVPDTEDDITGVSTGGIDVFSAWERVPGSIESHKWWRTTNDQSDAASGVTYRITE